MMFQTTDLLLVILYKPFIISILIDSLLTGFTIKAPANSKNDNIPPTYDKLNNRDHLCNFECLTVLENNMLNYNILFSILCDKFSSTSLLSIKYFSL